MLVNKALTLQDWSVSGVSADALTSPSVAETHMETSLSAWGLGCSLTRVLAVKLSVAFLSGSLFSPQ